MDTGPAVYLPMVIVIGGLVGAMLTTLVYFHQRLQSFTDRLMFINFAMDTFVGISTLSFLGASFFHYQDPH